MNADSSTAILVGVVTYGDRGVLCANTVQSILKEPTARAVVIAQGVTKNSRRTLESQFAEDPNTTLLFYPINNGSAWGFGRAIQTVCDMGTPDDTLILLDDDTPPPSGLLVGLKFRRQRLERSGSFSTPNSRVVIGPARPALSLERLEYSAKESERSPFLHFDLFDRVERAVRSQGHAEAPNIRVPELAYGGMCLSIAQISEVGIPDPSFVLYEDDSELSHRLAASGNRLFVCRDLVLHDQSPKHTPREGRGATRVLRSNSEVRLYYATRNRAYLDAHPQPRNLFRFWINVILFALALVLNCRSRSDVRRLATWFDAVNAGLRGRLGPNPKYPLVGLGMVGNGDSV